MSWVDTAEPFWALNRAASCQGQASSTSRRSITEGAKRDGGSHSDVVQRLGKTLATLSLVKATDGFRDGLAVMLLAQLVLLFFRALIKATPMARGLSDAAGAEVKTFLAERVLKMDAVELVVAAVGHQVLKHQKSRREKRGGENNVGAFLEGEQSPLEREAVKL